MENTAIDINVYTGNSGIFKVHTRLRVQQFVLLSSSRRVQAVQQTNTCLVESTKDVESTEDDNVEYTGSIGLFKVCTRLCVQQYNLLYSSRRVQAVQTC